MNQLSNCFQGLNKGSKIRRYLRESFFLYNGAENTKPKNKNKAGCPSLFILFACLFVCLL